MTRQGATHDVAQRLVCAAIVALAVNWRLPIARAQDSGEPIVIGQREKVSTFGLANVRAVLDLIYRYQNDTSSVASSNNFSENHFEQTFTLSADSWIVHPNLVDLKLSGTFGLTEEQSTQSGINDSQFGTLEEYDLNAVILRKEIAPLTVFAQRYRELITRQFGSSLDTTTDTYGLDWNIRSKVAPTQLQLYRLSISQVDPREQQDFQSTQDTFAWHTEVEPADFQRLTWDYTFNNVSQNASSLNTNTFQSHNATLSHSVDFGDKQQNNLYSTLNIFDQTGALAIRHIQWDEALLLRHTDTFSTNYRYSFSDEQQPLSQQTVHRASAGFEHRLYKSLITSGNAGVTMSDFGDQGNSFEKFANLNFDYTKVVPYGSLTADASFTFDQQDNTQSGGVVHVSGESHTFNDPLPVIISRSNIVVGSVLVSNTTRTVIYTDNIDYTVDYFSDHVELRRKVGGAIADGDTVLVDYSVSSEPSNTVTTMGQGFGIRYAIEEGPLTGLDFYARFFHQSQDIQSNDPASFVPDEVTDITVGADYRIWKMTFNAEHQIHDSTISPFDNTRFSARFSDRLSRETSYDLNATYALTNYPQQGNQTTYMIFNGSLQHQLTKELFVSGGLTIRDERDNLRGPNDAFEQHIELRWKHRQTEVYLQGRNSFVTSDTEDRTSQYLLFGIRRKF